MQFQTITGPPTTTLFTNLDTDTVEFMFGFITEYFTNKPMQNEEDEKQIAATADVQRQEPESKQLRLGCTII